MNTLEKILDFEKEADVIIQKAREKSSEFLSGQKEDVTNLEKEVEGKIAKGKDALKTQWNQRRVSLEKEESQRRDVILKKIKTDFSHNIDKAVETVLNQIMG